MQDITENAEIEAQKRRGIQDQLTVATMQSIETASLFFSAAKQKEISG